MPISKDYEQATTLDRVYRLCGRYAEHRAKYYMKRHGMSESEACQAAVAWWRNTERQRRMRLSHGTGAS
jgi:hypothetical protein